MVLLARLFVGLVLLIAGILKSLDLDAFRKAIVALNIVPYQILEIIIYSIPIIEIITGCMLCIGLRTRAAAIAGGLLLITFAAVVFPSIVMGENVNCGCFGPLTEGTADISLLMRNIILIVITSFVFNHRSYTLSLDQSFSKGSQSGTTR